MNRPWPENTGSGFRVKQIEGFLRPVFTVLQMSFLSLLLLLPAHAIPDGDLAPLGARDGEVVVADALIALRYALNLIQPLPVDDLLHGDVAPLGANNIPQPSGSITIADALLILRKALGLVSWDYTEAGMFPVIDTKQVNCFSSDGIKIFCGSSPNGQDAQYATNAPNLRNNDDGTVTDVVAETSQQCKALCRCRCLL